MLRAALTDRRDHGRGVLGSLATAFSSQVVLVATGILIARALGVEGRGELAVIMLVPSALAQLGTLGLPLALTFEVARFESRSPQLARALFPWIGVQALLLTAAGAALLLALVPAGNRAAVAAALPILPALVIQQYGLAILQGGRRFGAFNCARVAPAVLYAAGLGALVVTGNAALTPVVAVWTAANVLVGVVAAAVVLEHARRPTERAKTPGVRSTIGHSLRALAGSQSPSDALRADQVIVALMLPRTALGLYVVALAFTNLPRFISQSLGMVALPLRAAEAPGDAHALRRLYLLLVAVTGGSVVVGLELAVGRLVPLLFGGEFAGAVTAARVLLVAALVLAVRRVLADLAHGAGRPGAGALAEAAYLVVGIPAILAGAALFGIVGVAGAVTLAATVSVLVVAVAARDRCEAPSARISVDAAPAPAGLVGR